MTSPSPFSSIQTALSRLRRQLRAQALIASVGCFAAMMSGGLLVVIILASNELIPSWFATMWPSVLLGVSLWPFFSYWYRTVQKTRDDHDVAVFWESYDRRFQDGLIASVQFARQWRGEFTGDRDAAIHLSQWIERELESENLTLPKSSTPMRAGWVIAGCFGLAFLTWSAVDTESLHAGWSNLNSEPSARVQIEEGPLIADLTLIVDPPAYSGKSRRIIPNSTGTVKALRGSKITVTAETLEASKAAFLMVGDREITADSEGSKLKAEFEVTSALDWRAGLYGMDGARRLESKPRRVSLLADKSPQVSMTVPAADIVLERIEPISVEFETRDDFGIEEVNVVIALASDLERPHRFPQGGVEGKRFRGADEIDLRAIDVQSGDRVALWVHATDNRSIDGPQEGVSETRYITIKSPEDDHYALTEELHGLIDRLINGLADRLELPFDRAQYERTIAGLETLQKQNSDLLEDVSGLMDRLKKDPLTPDDIKEVVANKFQEFGAPITEEGMFLMNLRTERDVIKSAKLVTARGRHDAIIEGFEGLIIYMEALVSRIALEDIALMTEELKSSRQRLRDLISAYKDNPNPALKDRILRNIQRLRDRMKSLQARMAQLRQKLPDEFLNIEGLKQGEVSKGLEQTKNQLDDIEKMLEEGRIEDALAAVDEMSETLDALSDSLDSDMQKLEDDTNPELQRAISELMDKAKDLSRRQKVISDETEALAKKKEEATNQALKEDLQDALKAIIADAQALRRLIEGLAGKEWPAFGEEALNAANDKVNRLNDALDEMRLADALERAENALKSLRDLEHYARFVRKPDGHRKEVAAGIALDQRIIKKLSDLLNAARQQAEAASDPKKMDELRDQQEELGNDVQALRQEIDERSQEMPQLGGAPRQSAQAARQAMSEAGQSMRGRRPRHARSRQDEAQNQLNGLLKSLKQSGQPKPSGERQSRRMKQEKVKIPGSEDHQAPEAFRKELMDAMKDKAPERFRESVKRYYEELVK